MISPVSSDRAARLPSVRPISNRITIVHRVYSTVRYTLCNCGWKNTRQLKRSKTPHHHNSSMYNPQLSEVFPLLRTSTKSMTDRSHSSIYPTLSDRYYSREFYARRCTIFLENFSVSLSNIQVSNHYSVMSASLAFEQLSKFQNRAHTLVRHLAQLPSVLGCCVYVYV